MLTESSADARDLVTSRISFAIVRTIAIHQVARSWAIERNDFRKIRGEQFYENREIEIRKFTRRRSARHSSGGHTVPYRPTRPAWRLPALPSRRPARAGGVAGLDRTGRQPPTRKRVGSGGNVIHVSPGELSFCSSSAPCFSATLTAQIHRQRARTFSGHTISNIFITNCIATGHI